MSSYYETLAGCLEWHAFGNMTKRAIYNGYTICYHIPGASGIITMEDNCHAVKYQPEHFSHWVGFGNADQDLISLLEKIDKGEL